MARRTFAGDLRAEFFYDPVHEFEPDADLYPIVASDQVRFYTGDATEPTPITDVPHLTFTEAMRDVDLFVGVTSVAADPEWLDRGDGPRPQRYEGYWRAIDHQQGVSARRRLEDHRRNHPRADPFLTNRLRAARSPPRGSTFDRPRRSVRSALTPVRLRTQPGSVPPHLRELDDRRRRQSEGSQTFMDPASITITLDRYGHLMPGSEDEAVALLNGYLRRED